MLYPLLKKVQSGSGTYQVHGQKPQGEQHQRNKEPHNKSSEMDAMVRINLKWWAEKTNLVNTNCKSVQEQNMQCYKMHVCFQLRNCPQLTLSVEFTLKVKLAVNGPNILTSFCGVKENITLSKKTENVLILQKLTW